MLAGGFADSILLIKMGILTDRRGELICTFRFQCVWLCGCRGGRLAVDETRQPVHMTWKMIPELKGPGISDENCPEDTRKCFRSPGAISVPATADQIAIYHFATKSLEDFANKMARGSSMSRRTRKKMSYFAEVARCVPIHECHLRRRVPARHVVIGVI